MIAAGEFVLRPYTDADAAEMSAAVRESHATVGCWMTWAKPDFSAYDALCWFAQCTAARATGDAHEFGLFSASGEFIGGCGLNQIARINKIANLGYWIRQSQQRKGAAVAATLALRDLAFGGLGLARVEIVVAEGNEPSLGVARKSGATYECLARNRIHVHGRPTDAHVFSFVTAPVAG